MAALGLLGDGDSCLRSLATGLLRLLLCGGTNGLLWPCQANGYPKRLSLSWFHAFAVRMKQSTDSDRVNLDPTFLWGVPFDQHEVGIGNGGAVRGVATVANTAGFHEAADGSFAVTMSVLDLKDPAFSALLFLDIGHSASFSKWGFN